MISTRQVDKDVRDALRAQMEINETGGYIIPRKTVLSAKLIPEHLLQGEAKRWAYKVNSLTSLFYFATVVLKKNKFQTVADPKKNLHFQMCLSVMKDGIKDVIKIPRRHYKTTVYSECFSMWRALPFGKEEEDRFTSFGFSDLFIEWMRRAHSQDIRILIVSEVIGNAIKIGTRINHHYRNNKFFIDELFPELKPGAQDIWTTESMHQKRTEAGAAQGEGTFDFLGVGGAIQSRHYNLVIQDDLVGKEALNSEPTMKKTIEYHQLLVGASEDGEEENAGKDFDELVVGNDWSYKDLNQWIEENEKYFTITSHAALGGCCAAHPFGVPIFPERFNLEILMRWKKRLGSYHFSCQFLNAPLDPSKAKFKMSDFRYFSFVKIKDQVTPPKVSFINAVNDVAPAREQYRVAIRHHVAEGDVIKDVFPRNIQRKMIIDPNHSGEQGRCRHALVVIGINDDPHRLYLYDQWAKSCSIDEFIRMIFQKALKWKMTEVHVEAVGAQKYLLYHLNTYVKENGSEQPEIRNIKFIPLKTPNHAGAKKERIDNIVPSSERHEIWLNAENCDEFKEEAEAWGQKKGLIDLLDIFGYIYLLVDFETVSEEAVEEFLEKRYNLYKRSIGA